MRHLTLSLDALPHLRESTGSDVDLAAAATLAKLAGADAVRIGINEDLKPVGEHDVAEARRAVEEWEARDDKDSWYADQVRLLLVSRVSVKLDHSLLLIRTLVALCPMIGLLGTVTGMIEVFDVMAISGSGNVRAMASGVSKATIPTMAGMVAALSGLIFSVQWTRFARQQGQRVADQLTRA